MPSRATSRFQERNRLSAACQREKDVDPASQQRELGLRQRPADVSHVADPDAVEREQIHGVGLRVVRPVLSFHRGDGGHLDAVDQRDRLSDRVQRVQDSRRSRHGLPA